MTDLRPTVGGDRNTWGSKLLTWLGGSINSDGSLVSSAVRTALGGSLPIATSSVTRDASNRVTAFTNTAGSYTVTYDASTGLPKTISNGTTTRTISRDASGLVTGVA